MHNITGRKAEIEVLRKALQSPEAALVAVYGRRRVGKTYLIQKVYASHLIFEFCGITNISRAKQLKNFNQTLNTGKKKLPLPKDWLDAFQQLKHVLDRYTSRKKKVIFIDEFPWFDTRRSDFLPAFEHFWNSYAVKRNDLVLVICGSAASYMVKHVIKSRGGLHNRITHKLRLLPFSLLETEQLLNRKRVKLTRYDIVQLYMALGGVPYYLNKVEPGDSVASTLDKLCFSMNGFLCNEFEAIFKSLFDNSDHHENIVRILAKVRKGLTRTILLKKTKIPSGGTLTKTLNELEESGFIEKYMPYKGVKNAIYRLTDEYSLFYLKFIEPNRQSKNRGLWLKLCNKASYKSWAGFSFESLCLKHVEQIKTALQIAGIYSIEGSWTDKDNVQIDLLIDRDDNVINICELKYYDDVFVINKRYANQLEKKLTVFKQKTSTTKNIFLTFITSKGLKFNKYRTALVQNELTLEDLFAEL